MPDVSLDGQGLRSIRERDEGIDPSERDLTGGDYMKPKNVPRP